MNKRKYILILGTLFILIITGCTKDMEVKNENVKQHSNNLNNQNDALQQKLESLQNQNDQLRKQLAEYKEKSSANQREIKDYQTLREKIVEIMNIQSFNYTVLSNKVKEKHNETVVYVEDVPKSHERKEMYLLRASIDFSSESYEMVSFWDDYEKAKSYVEGTYNSEEGVLGWSGLDSRFGRLNNTLQKPKLYFHLSRDDIMLLDFGKYTSAE